MARYFMIEDDLDLGEIFDVLHFDFALQHLVFIQWEYLVSYPYVLGLC